MRREQESRALSEYSGHLLLCSSTDGRLHSHQASRATSDRQGSQRCSSKPLSEQVPAVGDRQVQSVLLSSSFERFAEYFAQDPAYRETRQTTLPAHRSKCHDCS